MVEHRDRQFVGVDLVFASPDGLANRLRRRRESLRVLRLEVGLELVVELEFFRLIVVVVVAQDCLGVTSSVHSQHRHDRKRP